MKKLLPTLSLLFFSVFINAQEKEIDSLNELLKKHKEPDTIRLNILNSLSHHYASVNVEEGILMSDQAIALAQKLDYKEQLARAYINKANNYIIAGKDSLALKLFHKIIDLSNAVNKAALNAKAFYGMARIYQNWSEYEKAIDYYNKAYHIFNAKKDNLSMAQMLNGIGICYMYSSNYPKALENFIQALHYHEIDKQTETLAYGNVLSNIGLIYGRMEHKLNLSLEYNKKALSIYELNDYKLGVANVLSNMANTYDNLNQPIKAIELQKQSYDIFKSIGNKVGMANTYTNIGIAYTSIPDYEKSIYYLEQTLPIYKELGNKNNLGIVEYYLGEVFLEMSLSVTNLTKSESHLKQAILLSKETRSIQIQADSYNALSKLYSNKQDYKKALEYKELAIVLHDSLTSQDFKDEITRLEVKYQYDKEAEIVRLEHERNQAIAHTEIERQKLIKNGSIIGGSTLVFGIICGFFLYGRKRKAEFNAQVSDTELKALRAQMNPHFIFNSLNSINDFISKNDAASASNYLTKFAKVMRQILENSVENDISLEEDLKILDLYLQIEAMRLKNKFTYAIKVDDTIDTENTLVPPLILQPFIENSIWHGISKKESGGHIDISIKKEGSMLICTVDDNGVGRTLKTKDSSTEKKSLGISITKKRIDIINKRKNSNGAIKLTDKEQGVRVEVTLPLQLVF